MPYKLWLDDDRPAPQGWVWAKTAKSAIGYLERYESILRNPRLAANLAKYSKRLPGIWEITQMSFDHDLADVHYEYWYIGHHPGAGGLSKAVREEARRRAAKEMTGYDVLLWMAEHEVWPTEACYVHTQNDAAQEKMCGVIDRYGPYETKVRWTPASGKVDP